MKISRIFMVLLLFSISHTVFPQSDSLTGKHETILRYFYGFARTGFYGWTGGAGFNPSVSSGYMDLGLKFDKDDGTWLKFFADLRYRYGYEFMKPVSRFSVREAMAVVYGKKWNATFGQQIIKWGRTDIINPLSKLNPRDLIARSSDKEDVDLGNLSARIRYYPGRLLNFEAVATPFYRPSIMITDLIPMPSYVSLEELSGIRTDRMRFTYAFRADMHLKVLDMGFSWFDGFDPMPGTMLKSISTNSSGPVILPHVELAFTPYRIRNAGIDFEATAGETILRGEVTWSIPYRSFRNYEYVPMPEINWVAGIERFFGDWHVNAEYSGKFIPGFVKTNVNPVISTVQVPVTSDTELFLNGFDFENYLKAQVGAFNMLYNYQLFKWYHSAAFRLGKDMLHGNMNSSVLVLYNFTSRDLYINPSLSVKPLEGLTVKVGLDYFSGRRGSLYDLTDAFLNSINLAVRIDF